MPDEQPLLTISLQQGDWQVILAGLYELAAKHSVPVIGRLQTAMADAQKTQPEPLKEAAE